MTQLEVVAHLNHRIAELTRANEKMRLTLTKQRDAFERQRPLCPDHRDKQQGECIVCRLERR